MHVEFKLSNTDVILTAPSCPALLLQLTPILTVNSYQTF